MGTRSKYFISFHCAFPSLSLLLPPRPTAVPVLTCSAALLKLAAEETVATASDAGYIGTLINACRDAAQQSVEQE
jgi:hypothetical protein